MNKAEEELLDYLRNLNALRQKMKKPDGFHYWGMEDFLLQHGRFYTPGEWPYSLGAPKACFANSMIQTTIHSGLEYVEGYALTSFGFPVHHGWNTDGELALDSTWEYPGMAYFGVQFHPRRAWESQWDGDTTVLDDWKRGFPIFRQPWTGEIEWENLTLADLEREYHEQENPHPPSGVAEKQ
ncbi:hypothetical protein J2P12_00020 [Candidatus Bathyarchaeota archaeon]|nr:hypothetical protein [Candidatus Bathyarchaeota archaeon]